MRASEKGGYAIGMDSALFEFEAEFCSVCGRSSPNEDYALFEKNVGMCVADGIGGAPLGDAIARYACHVAMDVLRGCGTAHEAVTEEGNRVRRFVTTVDSLGSGASLVVARIDGDTLDASWAGDAAIFVQGPEGSQQGITTSLERCQPESSTPLCGRSRANPGRLSKELADGETIIMCTDGVWRRIDRETIARLILEGVSPREAAARLVLAHQSEDDSTALVARILKSGRTCSARRQERSHQHGYRHS